MVEPAAEAVVEGKEEAAVESVVVESAVVPAVVPEAARPLAPQAESQAPVAAVRPAAA